MVVQRRLREQRGALGVRQVGQQARRGRGRGPQRRHAGAVHARALRVRARLQRVRAQRAHVYHVTGEIDKQLQNLIV